MQVRGGGLCRPCAVAHPRLLGACYPPPVHAPTHQPPPPSEPAPFHAVDALVIVGIIAGAGVLLQGTFAFETFTDRDILRALRWPGEAPHLGPELGGSDGARLPSYAFAAAWAGLLRLGFDAEGLYVAQVVAFGVAVYVWSRTIRHVTSPGVGAWTAMLWFTAQTQLHTVTRLWNPGWIPLPMAVLLAATVRGIHARDARWLPVIGVAAALGAHAHLVFVPVGATAGACVLWWAQQRRQQGAWLALMGVVLVYLPYGLIDAANGFHNTKLLLNTTDVATGGGGSTWNGLSQSIRLLLGERLGHPLWGADVPGHRWTSLGLRVAPLFAALTAILAVLRAPIAPAATRPLVATLSVMAVTTIASFSLGTVDRVEARYVSAVEPLVAALAAVGLHAVVCTLAERPGLMRSALAMVVAMLLAGRALPMPRYVYVDGTSSYAGVKHAVHAGSSRANLTVPDFANRTVFWDHIESDEDLAWNMWVPTKHLAPDAPTLAAARSPCFVLLNQPERTQRPPDPASVPPIRWVDGRPLGPPTDLGMGWLLYTYDVSGHCPASTQQRYIDTPTEARIARTLGTTHPRCGDASALIGESSDAPGIAFRPSRSETARGCHELWLGLTVDHTVGEATFHGNQLRGAGDNGGWLTTLAVHAPHLIGWDDNGVARWLRMIEPGWVGGLGAKTPIAFPWPPPSSAVTHVTFHATTDAHYDANQPWPPRAPDDRVFATWSAQALP